MRKKLILICFLFFCFRANANAKYFSQNVKDTIYLITLVDLFEVAALVYDINKPLLRYKHEIDDKGMLMIKNNPYLAKDREFISSFIKDNIKNSDEVIIVNDTSCLKGLLADSISRRKMADIKEVCRRCGFKRILLFDVQWRYMNHSRYVWLCSESTVLSELPRNLPGTRWKIRVKFYDSSSGRIEYEKEYLKFKNWTDYKPEEIVNRYDYRRFFHRASKDFDEFLLKKH